MPRYVPIQDMEAQADLNDTDYVPVSDGETSFAVQASKFKAYSTDRAEAAASAAEASATQAAADAAKYGDVKRSVRLVPSLDLIAGGTRENGTNAGITFTWNAEKTECTANGTATGTTSSRIFIAGESTSLPDGIKPGSTYRVKVKTTNTNLYLGFMYYVDGVYSSAATFREDTDVTIPATTTGMRVSVSVAAGVTVVNEKLYDFAVVETEAVDVDTFDVAMDAIQKDLATLDRMIDPKGYVYPEIESGGLSLNNGVIVKSPNAKRVRLASSLSDGMFEISCDDGYFYLLWVRGAAEGYGNPTLSGSSVVSFDSGGEFSVSMGRVDDGDIAAAEGRHLHIRRVTDFKTPAEIKFNGVIRLGDINAPDVSYTYRCSDVFKIPEGGFSVSVPFEAVQANKKFWNASFYKMDEFGLLVTNPSYSYGYMVDGKTVNTSMTIYYPYEENTYVQIGATNPEDTTITTYDRKEGGRPLTLAPVAIKAVYDRTTSPATLLGYEPTFKVYASGDYTPPQMTYGTIIRLEDADGICCAPRYSLSAWFYDEAGTIVDAVYSTPSPHVAVGGPTYIDFRGRNAVFAVVGIRCAAWSSGSAAADRDTDTMGILAREDDVLDSVHVMWKQHVTITHRNEIPQIIGENIRWLKNFTFPEVKEHMYRGPWTKNQMRFHSEKNATLGFYAGNAYANTVLNMVTMESYATALQNPYSRDYVGAWLPYSINNGVVQKPVGYIGRGYGWICGNLPHILCGFKWFSEASGYYKIPSYHGFEIIKDFDLRSDVDKLRAGDWLWGEILEGNPSDGYIYDYHVLMVTDIVYVSGVPYCVEFLEVYPPMVRRRFLCLDRQMSVITDEFGSEDDFNYYNLVSRPNPRDLRRIEDVWDTSISDYTLGKLACDRGHNSVYCLGDLHIYVTVFDDAVETFDIIKNDDTAHPTTITIGSSYINLYQSPYKTVDIIETIKSLGVGKYDLYVGGEAQDSFLVPDMPSISIDWDHTGGADGYVEVDTFGVRQSDGRVLDPNGYEIINMVGWYYPTVDEGYPAPEGSEEIEYIYNPETGEWEPVTVPGGDYSPAAGEEYGNLRFKLSFRPEEISSGKVRFPYATKFFDKDFVFNWVQIQYTTECGGFTLGQDRFLDEDEHIIKERRWYNTDGRILQNPIVLET